MKILYIKLLFFLVCSFYSISCFSQTDNQRVQIIKATDVTSNLDLSAKLDEESKQRLERIRSAGFKAPTIFKAKDGSEKILYDVLDDGTPVFIETHNFNAAITVATNELYQGGSLNLSLSGAGFEIGVWDGGNVRDTHQEFDNRVINQESGSLSSHATHVSGTIASSGQFDVQSKGMAFNSTVKAYDFGNDTSEMIIESNSGLLISNHSYGLSPDNLPDAFFGNYNSQASTIDQITFNSPYYTAVFSAGNSRNAPASQGGPYNSSKHPYDLLTGKNLAKNVIAVANTQQVLNYTNRSSVMINNSSSYGPTDDGRIKPDIAAKGTNTYSTYSNSDDAYESISGTSMAAPSVAGSLLLLQELNMDLNNEFLKSATLKALAIGTSRDAGNFAGPDYRFGFGLLYMEGAANALLNHSETSYVSEETLTDGQTYTLDFIADPDADKLVATIVWTDPSGPTQSQGAENDPTIRLVNDLDMRVESNGTTFEPWILNPTIPTLPATKGDNFRDNVEKIEIDNPQGSYSLTVNHKASLQNGAQDFSIVITGAEDVLSNENFNSESFYVYPNPVKDNLYFGGNTMNSQNLDVTIYNIQGKMVFSKSEFYGDKLDLSSLKTGVYLLRMTSDNNVFSKKIIVE
ncbi:S8 family serine peptidase [Psychroflexus aestuariivivens]|uniref:S8 family serine peptidase n=1 Tax=Psychroflexus aestuariivivens TaxID=1795040 RepID=UPI000FD97BF9|nr:S8 family serine peptidase [Psychroflexus aestuariivivens]